MTMTTLTTSINERALHKLGYGMYIVGSRKDGKLNAQIANTVFQITTNPPTIAVSINKKNLTHEFIKTSRVFSASVLCQGTPLPFIGRFGFKSGRDINKLEGINYKIGVTKSPIILDNAVAYLEVKVVQEMDVGDHTVFVGEVVSSEVIAEKACMTYDYYHQVKRGTVPKEAPGYIKKEEMKKLAKYECLVCGWVYDPEIGDPDGDIKPGIPFEQLPDNWVCPVCGAGKDQFRKLE
jgi:flavin reductase (DIM6/NTAB) family NADH-FMN oxidoreductase RutF/rubredoxin